MNEDHEVVYNPMFSDLTFLLTAYYFNSINYNNIAEKRIRISLMKKNDDQTDQRLPTTRDRNEWRYADCLLASDSDLDVNASFVLSSRPYLRRYLSFLLAFSHLVNGTGEPTRDGHATFMILSRFLAILRSSSLPAASYPNWTGLIGSFHPLYDTLFPLDVPGAQSYISFFATAGPSVASSFRWSYCACLYI